MKRIIQMSNLGNNGRFGNQLFQYSFLKSYAEMYECELQIPSNWIGRQIFPNIKDNSIDRVLPKHYESDFSLYGKINIDLDGQYTTRYHTKIINRENVKKWFTFDKKYQKDNIFPKFDYNAVHLRRTDFSETISKKCLDYWVDKYGEGLPTIFLSDDPNYSTNKNDFGIENSNFDFDFIQDFIILMNAKNIFRSASTFSWWSSELSQKENQKVYSPIVCRKISRNTKDQFVEYTEGNYNIIAVDTFIDFIKDEQFYEIYFGNCKR